MALISITRLRVRSARYLPAFLWYTALSTWQAKRAPGCFAVRLLRDTNNTFWTSSAWQDEAAVRAFILYGAHRRAMPRLLAWCDEASVVHWHQDAAELPNWSEAHRRMVEEGRRSKVHHPSLAHNEYRIPQPKA